MPTVDPEKKRKILEAATFMKNILDNNPRDTTGTIPLLDHIRAQAPFSWNQIEAHFPSSNCHHEWMHFAHLLTVAYNRTMNEEIYSVISRVLQLPIILV